MCSPRRECYGALARKGRSFARCSPSLSERGASSYEQETRGIVGRNSHSGADSDCGRDAKVNYYQKTRTATVNPIRRLTVSGGYPAFIEGVGDGLAVKDDAGNEVRKDHLLQFKTGRK